MNLNVTKSIDDYALVTGNPAKHQGWMSEHGAKLIFDENGKATCEISGASYQLINNRVSKIA